jgi:acetolactate synthase-1/2/3 large subunit
MSDGATEIWAALRSRGVDVAFGLPGTQSVALHDALRGSGVRSVVTTTELAAAFMAIGYFRGSGRVASVVTIPGPGFTYALTGLAEALHDSAALVHLFGRAPVGGRPFQFQAIDQRAIAAPLLKGIVEAHRAGDAGEAACRAVDLARRGEPGPVGLEWDGPALSAPVAVSGARSAPPAPDPGDDGDLAKAAGRLRAARLPLLLLGGGASDAAASVRSIAEALHAPVLTTVSGRGILPEDHPLALGWDAARSGIHSANELIRRSDCVLAIGCKLTAAATVLFELQLPPERLIRVDASAEVLAAGYPASLAIVASSEAWVPRLASALDSDGGRPGSAWTPEEIGALRGRLRDVGDPGPEPVVHGTSPSTPASLFASLRRALPRDGIVVTDSGMHQELARRYLDVLAPRGLVTPSDFQSMGFGIPAAIGAAIGAPHRRVVAVVGDGGFAMAGMELLTAVRERVPLTVVVLADGRFNRIRLQQLAQFGRGADVDILNPDFASFADAVGATPFRIDGDAEEVLRTAISSPGVSLVEVRMGDSVAIHTTRLRGIARRTARATLGTGLTAWWRRRRGRHSR